MSLTTHQPPLKKKANTAAADPDGTNGTAVATQELFAAIVLFQRHYPTVPPAQNVNSAPCSPKSACQFSGNIAQIAITIAASITA